MSLRNSLNAGELSPQVQLRNDLDVFARGCSLVENFDIGQAGGVSRRRGFRRIAPGEAGARLFAYSYTRDVRFLVEVGASKVRVYTPGGDLRFEAGSPYQTGWLDQVRGVQVKSLLLLTCPYAPVMQLACDAAGAWCWGEYSFKEPAWRHTGYRDTKVRLTRAGDSYAAEFDPAEAAEERTMLAGDVLRVAFYTEAARVKADAASVMTLIGDAHFESLAPISGTTTFSAGDVFAVRSAPETAVYSCIEDFLPEGEGEEEVASFVEGLVDPANYPGNFQLASDPAGATGEISELTAESRYEKGDKFKFSQGYWELWTCVRDYTVADHVTGKNRPEDYPGFFRRGVMLGSAACGGAWTLKTSGTWYGSYEVRASYDGNAYDADWERRGEVFSQNAAPVNTPLGGDEGAEVCWVSLWLTRIRAYGNTWGVRNFPAESCGNVLEVHSYRHAMQFRVGAGRSLARCERVQADWSGSLETLDWSWAAFSSRYGFPALAAIHDQRLVLAATDAQPQTVWMSQTDDLDNFAIIDEANGAIAVTLSAQTQDPLRWMESHSGKLVLGTSEGEYVIMAASTGSVMSATNIAAVRQGYVGGAGIAAVQCTGELVYFERGRARVMQHSYDDQRNCWVSTDLTVFAEHILPDGQGVRGGCFVRKPDARLVLVLGNGTLALMTYNSEHQVNAWHRYTTEGRFLAVCSLPNGDKADSICVEVEREGVVSIEVLEDGNPYVDEGGRDYVSTVLTNFVHVQRKGSEKVAAAQLLLWCGEERPRDGVEVSVDGGARWAKLDRGGTGKLLVGWNTLTGWQAADTKLAVGFRASGPLGLVVRGLQL